MEHLVIPAEQRHGPHRWEVEDAAAREAINPNADQIGKTLWQKDDNTIWIVTDDQEFANIGGLGIVNTSNRLYGTANDGSQTTYEVSTGASLSGTVVRRTTNGAAQGLTPADGAGDASSNDFVTRSYVGQFRNDRIEHGTLNNGGSKDLPANKDVLILYGGPVASFSVTLPSDLNAYRQVIVKFVGAVTTLTLDPGTHGGTPNEIDATIASAEAGECWILGYDWNSFTWMAVSHYMP